MAYTLYYSGGSFTVADGTLNTANTSLALPGRNYAGYGQPVDQNLVDVTESFARYTSGPVNAIRGQLWFNTANSTLSVNTSNTVGSPSWQTLISAGSNTTFGNITVGNITVTGTSTTSNITTGSPSTPGTLEGNWSFSSSLVVNGNENITGNLTVAGTIFGNVSGNISGNLVVPGSNTEVLFNNTGNAGASANLTFNNSTNNLTVTGNVVVSTGAFYGNGAGLTNISGANITGTVASATTAGTVTTGAQPNITSVGTLTSLTVSGALTTTNITTGAAGTAGSITGNWTLTASSRLNATYADLAERFEADAVYDGGTVVELGGSREITAVSSELSENIFGVVSDTAGYLMNAAAGDDLTHPPVAMTGRVLVKVVGIVRKGDRLVSAGGGRARAARTGEATSFNTIGRALEDKLIEGTGKVLAVVSAKL